MWTSPECIRQSRKRGRIDVLQPFHGTETVTDAVSAAAGVLEVCCVFYFVRVVSLRGYLVHVFLCFDRSASLLGEVLLSLVIVHTLTGTQMVSRRAFGVVYSVRSNVGGGQDSSLFDCAS